MGNTSIEWTDMVWNPTRGCTRVSEGCRNCYAERFAARYTQPGQAFHQFAKVVAPRDDLDRVSLPWIHRRNPIADVLAAFEAEAALGKPTGA